MKKLFLGIAVLSLVLFASSAMAQDIAKASDKATTLSILGSVVGKLVSVYSDSNSSQTITTSYPSYTVVASTTVPAKYKSKSQWLIIQVTMQENCTANGRLASVVFVGGVAAYPDDGGTYAFECSNNGGWETRTRTWFLPPENLGGPAVTAGSTVEVRVVSSLGTEAIADRSIIIQAVK